MKLIILDRDGTINHDSDAYIKSASEWWPIDGALEAIAQLNRAGYRVAVATNQAAIGRGLFSVETLDSIHAKMHAMAKVAGATIDSVFYCPHKPEDKCNCRKPQPGLLYQISEHYGVNLNAVPMVGDTLRDMQAADSAGCQPHLVLTGKSESLVELLEAGGNLPNEFPHNTQIHHDLASFARFILSKPAST